MRICHHCKTPWDSEKRQPGVKEYCIACSAWLHCCLNCRFHERGRPNQCQIPNTEAVADRAGANFCDEFAFREAAATQAKGQDETAVRDTIRTLFGDSPSPAVDAQQLLGGEAPTQPKGFDDLFRE